MRPTQTPGLPPVLTSLNSCQISSSPFALRDTSSYSFGIACSPLAPKSYKGASFHDDGMSIGPFAISSLHFPPNPYTFASIMLPDFLQDSPEYVRRKETPFSPPKVCGSSKTSSLCPMTTATFLGDFIRGPRGCA